MVLAWKLTIFSKTTSWWSTYYTGSLSLLHIYIVHCVCVCLSVCSDQPLGDDKEFLVLTSDQEKEDEDKEEEEEDVGQSRKRRAHDKPESSDTPKKQRLEPATWK